MAGDVDGGDLLVVDEVIDPAEPNAALPDGLLPDIARAKELPWLAELRRDQPEVHWDRLLFTGQAARVDT